MGPALRQKIWGRGSRVVVLGSLERIEHRLLARLKLHDYAIDGVRRALPAARVGGMDTAGSGGRITRSFIEHCLRGTNYATGQIGTPLDFISFHAKGAPTYTNGHVRMGIANQLRTVDEGFKI